ncbi:MAG TPA: hypothetical protein PK657_12565 [Legionella sp.]|nr:hypothetical protein [Legionella sp.]
MFGESLSSPFLNIGISLFIKRVNNTYFNDPSQFYLHPPNRGFYDERAIKASDNDEGRICTWLWRIGRYFLIENAGKKETANLISEFLSTLGRLPEEIQRFLCLDSEALNCVLFTMLLNRNQDDWQTGIQLIKKYNSSSALHLLIDWAYKVSFILGPPGGSEEILTHLLKLQPDKEQLSLPRSPLSIVFTYDILLRGNSAQIIGIINPLQKTGNLTEVSTLSERIKLGISTQILVNDNEWVQRLIQDEIKKCLHQCYGMKLQNNSDLRKQTNSFLHWFLPYSLNYSSSLDKEHLIELANLFLLYNPKPFNYYGSIYNPIINLVEKIFIFGLYKEAYFLHDDITSVCSAESQHLVRSRSVLYCFMARVSEWCSEKNQHPEFNPIEMELVKSFKFLEKQSKFQEQFYDLAKRLEHKFQSSSDSVARNHCLNFYELIKEYLTKKQKKGFNFLFEENLTTTAVPKRNKVSGLSNRTRHSIHESSETSQNYTTNNSAPFFNAITPKTPRDLFLNRDTIPSVILQLIHDIKEKFPESRFYLTGAAPENIFHGITPNDYDILMLNPEGNYYAVHHFLSTKNISSEVRSVKNPFVYCDLGNQIFVDITVRSTRLTDVLQKDFNKRDFNLNALYCELDNSDKFKIFSFNNVENTLDRIEILNDNLTVFETEPILFFRLIKLVITHPTNNLSPDLKDAIKQFNAHWRDFFQAYDKAERGNSDRIVHAFRKLIERYSNQEINDALKRLEFINPLTDDDYKALEQICLPSINPIGSLQFS